MKHRRFFEGLALFVLFAAIGGTVGGGCGGGSGGSSGTPTPTPSGSATPTPNSMALFITRSGGRSSQLTGRAEGIVSNVPERFFGKNVTVRIEGHSDVQTTFNRHNPATSGEWHADIPNPNNPALYNRALPMKVYDPDGVEIPYSAQSETTYFWDLL